MTPTFPSSPIASLPIPEETIETGNEILSLGAQRLIEFSIIGVLVLLLMVVCGILLWVNRIDRNKSDERHERLHCNSTQAIQTNTAALKDLESGLGASFGGIEGALRDLNEGIRQQGREDYRQSHSRHQN